MSHLSIPALKSSSLALPASPLDDEWAKRHSRGELWTQRLRRALRRGLCGAGEVRGALDAPKPAQALRQLGWRIHERVRSQLHPDAPRLPEHVSPYGASAAMTPTRRRAIAAWLRDAVREGAIDGGAVRAALASKCPDEAVLNCAIAAWHTIAGDVVGEARQRGLAMARSGKGPLTMHVAPGWALDMYEDHYDFVFVEHSSSYLVHRLPWREMRKADTDAVLAGLGLIHRSVLSAFIFTPDDFYGGSPLSGYHDEVIDEYAGDEEYGEHDPPSPSLVAAYEAECGINLAEDTHAWEEVRNLIVAMRERGAGRLCIRT